jgi:hypothetical protein
MVAMATCGAVLAGSVPGKAVALVVIGEFVNHGRIPTIAHLVVNK